VQTSHQPLSHLPLPSLHPQNYSKYKGGWAFFETQYRIKTPTGQNVPRFRRPTCCSTFWRLFDTEHQHRRTSVAFTLNQQQSLFTHLTQTFTQVTRVTSHNGSDIDETTINTTLVIVIIIISVNILTSRYFMSQYVTQIYKHDVLY